VKRLKSTNKDLGVVNDQLLIENEKLKVEVVNVEKQVAEIAELRKSLELRQTELQKSDEENAKLKSVIKSKEDELANQKRTMEELMEELTKQLTRKNSELAMAYEQLHKVEEYKIKLQAALADKEKEIKMQYDDKSTKKPNEHEARSADKDKKIAEVESQLKIVQTQNADLMTQLQYKEREIAELHETARASGAATATDTEEENVEWKATESAVEITSELEAARGEIDKLNNLLTTWQQRYDKDTEFLRAQLQQRTGAYTVLLVLVYNSHFTARRYTSAVYAMALCLSVCSSVSVCHVGVLVKWLNGSSWFLVIGMEASFRLLCYKEIRLCPK